MKKAKKAPPSRRRLPDRASELLVNQRMLYGVRDELKAHLRSHDRRFDAMDARFDSMDARFVSMDAKFDSFREKITSDIRYMVTLVEEQNNRNDAVLDGYQSLYDRQDRVEKRVDELHDLILDVKKG